MIARGTSSATSLSKLSTEDGDDDDTLGPLGADSRCLSTDEPNVHLQAVLALYILTPRSSSSSIQRTQTY